jgi:hypothetical protein
VRIKKVTINRAPVLTLWASVVAERLGYDYETALTLGKGVAGLNAQSKGRRLGIFEEQKEAKEGRERRAREPGEQFMVNVVGRLMPAITTDEGIRATIQGKPIDPDSVRRYLENKFGNELAYVQADMEELTKAYKPDELAAKAYSLYEKFRPYIPERKRG